jgi:hypothetical protein
MIVNKWHVEILRDFYVFSCPEQEKAGFETPSAIARVCVTACVPRQLQNSCTDYTRTYIPCQTVVDEGTLVKLSTFGQFPPPCFLFISLKRRWRLVLSTGPY